MANAEKRNDLLSVAEIDQLIRAVMNGQGGATDEELDAVGKWAEEIRLRQIVLDMVLNGKLVVRVRDDGEVVCGPAKQVET